MEVYLIILKFSLASQAADSEERKIEKQARMKKMESLLKDMAGLLAQEGKTPIYNDNTVHPVFAIVYTVKCSVYFSDILFLCRIELPDSGNWILLPEV